MMLWDLVENIQDMESHAWLWGTYGTGPMCDSEEAMGPVPYSVQTDLWDRPHMCFWEHYGTGPMYVSEEAMGPVPYVILRHLGLVGGGGW